MWESGFTRLQSDDELAIVPCLEMWATLDLLIKPLRWDRSPRGTPGSSTLLASDSLGQLVNFWAPKIAIYLCTCILSLQHWNCHPLVFHEQTKCIDATNRSGVEWTPPAMDLNWLEVVQGKIFPNCIAKKNVKFARVFKILFTSALYSMPKHWK